MPWWGWIIVGALLLGAELVAVDAGFYLVFIGLAGVAVGLLGLLGVGLPVWGQWLLFAGLSLFFFYAFRRRLYRSIRGNLPGYTDGPQGSMIQMVESIPAGGTARQEFRGTTWTVRNTGQGDIPAGGSARITSVDGLTLIVHPHSSAAKE